VKRIKFSPTLGHLTNFCTNFYEFFYFGKFVKIRDFFAEVTNSRSMGLSVCLSVCLSVMIVSPVTTAEPIEMPSGLWTPVSPTKRILVGPAHWRHTANTIESSMCSGDETLCQTILITCCSNITVIQIIVLLLFVLL